MSDIISDLPNLMTLEITIAGATKYIPMFNAITESPNPNTLASEPSSANVIIERVESIGVIAIFTTSLNAGFSLSQSAICGEKE